MRTLALVLGTCVVAACGDAVRVVKRTIALQEAFFRQIDRRSPTPEIRDRLRNLARSGAGDSVQFLVAHGLARLDDSSLVHDDDQIGVADGAEAMGDYQRGPIAHKRLKRLNQAGLGRGIEAGGRLVKYEHRRILQQGARD